MHFRTHAFVVSLLLLCFGASLALGQTVTGTITGTVSDPSGAVVPDVTVRAINVATNLEYTAQSNAAGVYNILFLPAGNYRLTASSTGFKQTILGPFTLEVGQVARVDVRLELGEIAQTVEITSVAPILRTETAETGDTITANQATTLPLQGRNFNALTLLMPGAVTPAPTDFSAAARSNGRPFVNGNREQTNNFLLDGVDINESMDNGVGYSPNIDAIAEVKVLTGNASAEFGNANGAVVNMALKSGTNEFHGNVFEFLRNEKLDANDFFLNRGGQDRRALRRNIFGGTFGGPIVRDRAFFFMDYQGTRDRVSGPSQVSLAPAEWRQGNLSGIPRLIRDPLLGAPCQAGNTAGCFQNNQIPATRIVNPAALALFANPQLYPLPNQAGSGPVGVVNNFAGSSATYNDNDQADAKIDMRLTDSDNLSGRFSIARNRTATSSVAVPIQMGTAADRPTTGGVINWTRTFSPTVVNEARVGFTRIKTGTDFIDPTGLLGPNGNQTLGIPGGQPIAGASRIVMGEGLTDVGSAATASNTIDNHYQYGNNLTIQHGKHLIKTGFQALRYQQNRFYAGNNGLLGFFTYSGDFTGTAYADFLLNQLRQKGRGSQTGLWGHRQWRLAAFFQDDFKVRPNFTLNLGMRWEYTQPVYEVADRQANVDLLTGRLLLAGQDGNSRALYEPYYRQFMPRVGFAWTPGILNNRFVVRAAYGITSYMEGTGGNLRLPLNPPFFFESDVVYGTAAPGDIRSGFVDVSPIQGGAQLRAWNPELRPAFIQQWNFSLEHQFSNTFSLSAGYVGQKGSHLVNPREYNQPLPGAGDPSTWLPLNQRRPLFAAQPTWTNISGTDSSSNMFYNSLQVTGRKRLSTGLEFMSSYTYSKNITDNRGFYGKGGFVNSEGAYWQNAYDRVGDRGLAFFNATHIFNVGGTYQLPFGQRRGIGQSWNRLADSLLGGWNLGYIVMTRTGFPVTLYANDRSLQATRGFTRPNWYRGELNYSGQNVDTWFGTSNTFCRTPGVDDGQCSFGDPAIGSFGNAAKGLGTGPAFRNLDLSIGKEFRLSETNYFEFRAEFFNIFNHPNFGPPGSNIDAPATFGTITRTINDPRNIQLGLKYFF
jgi:hypothetical protein